MTTADVFTVALIKGAAEGDITRHFGSLGGFDLHLSTAQQLGLIYSGSQTLTSRGRALYDRHQLHQLPAGRAYLTWQNSSIVDAALADLARPSAAERTAP